MSAKFLVLRTHGGLGNQLFQVLYARLYAEQFGLSLREIHDTRYPHAFPRSEVIALSDTPSIMQRTLSDIRFPKILSRAMGRSEKPLRLGNTIYVDGYFQDTDSFGSFTSAAIKYQLDLLADELGIVASEGGQLVHLRLGDFFGNKMAAMEHVGSRISQVPAGSKIMTNDENLMKEPEIARILNDKNIQLITTEGMTAERVLREMSRYSRIDANNSTLAFWAAIFGHSELTLSDKKLQCSYQFFRNLAMNSVNRSRQDNVPPTLSPVLKG